MAVGKEQRGLEPLAKSWEIAGINGLLILMFPDLGLRG